MRKSTALLIGLVVLNGALLVGGHAVTGGGRAANVDMHVGLVFDVGGLGDKSFNDAAYRGLTYARDNMNVGIRYIEPGDGSDRESALRQLASSGSDLVIGVGFIFSDDITKLAAEFPDVSFVCIDYSGKPGAEIPSNLVGIKFREHEGAFLVGAIAGLKTETKKVGFVGGMKIPLIRKFEAGYEAGVKYVCPDCEVLGAYAGTKPEAFADPTTGRELADAQYSRGADIIFHASGKTGTGVFNAARERGKLAIGTDSDQFHEAPCCVLSSLLKEVDTAVVDAVRMLEEGRFRGGVRELGLEENGVSFVADDNNAHMLTPDIVDRVNSIRDQIIAGDIEVPFK
jgi:basic membrane protein A